jgi:hypothetical protein
MIAAKKLISMAALTLAVLAAQCVFAAESRITLHVPFAFVVAGRTMPAGAYEVETDDNDMVYVRGGHGAVMVTSIPGSFKPDERPALVFSRRGGSVYLTGIQTADSARNLTPSKAGLALSK